MRIQDDNFPAYSDYLAFRDRADVFTGLAAYDFDSFNLLSGSTSGRVGVAKVSGNYFDVLKVRMALGRPFSPDEDSTPGGHPVAVLSYGLWQSRFGGDPGIVGKSFTLQKVPFTIIGVASQEFQGVTLGWRHDLWIPFAMDARLHPENNLLKNPDSYQVKVIGRLKPEVGLRAGAGSHQSDCCRTGQDHKSPTLHRFPRRPATHTEYGSPGHDDRNRSP